nr:hypothetical protein [Tanacetum cinerariifolium]
MVMPANRIANVLALQGKLVDTAVFVKMATREIHICLLAAKTSTSARIHEPTPVMVV